MSLSLKVIWERKISVTRIGRHGASTPVMLGFAQGGDEQPEKFVVLENRKDEVSQEESERANFFLSGLANTLNRSGFSSSRPIGPIEAKPYALVIPISSVQISAAAVFKIFWSRMVFIPRPNQPDDVTPTILRFSEENCPEMGKPLPVISLESGAFNGDPTAEERAEHFLHDLGEILQQAAFSNLVIPVDKHRPFRLVIPVF